MTEALEVVFDPNNEIDEEGEFINEQDEQYEYWDMVEGEKKLVLITSFHLEDSYAHFVDDVNNYEQIKHLVNRGQLEKINPGEQKIDYDDEGEPTYYFEEWNTH